MRGKDNRPRYPGTCPGITPAHAGKSAYYTDVLQLRRDHPRVCGEKALKSWLMSGDVGSPPRVRGKEQMEQGAGRLWGITPACAGKRVDARVDLTEVEDHPRICGEKTKPVPAGGILMGSPPHVRGKACGVPLLCQHLGITPACAGKSRSFFVALSAALDHPRVCGEKFWALVRAVMALGSPPRMRGKERCGSGYRAPAGITPACAGKSSIQHLTASLGEFEVQKGHPVFSPAAAPAGLAGSCPASPP